MAWPGISSATICALCLANLAAPALGAERLTSEQRKRMYELLGEFRKNSRDLDKRAQAVDELVALGPVAASQLLTRLERELRMQRPGYFARLERAAMIAVAKKEKAADVKAIAADRAALEKIAGNPTKKLAASAWPAMQRLKKLHSVDPGELLAESEDLSERRAKVLALGSWADKCRAPVLEELKARGRDTSSLEKSPVPFDRLLALEDLFVTTRVSSVARRHLPILKTNEPLLVQLPEEEARGIRDLNLMRIIMGRTPLRVDLKLCDAARDHCKDMRDRGFFSHDSPVPGKATVGDRARKAGTTGGGENICKGQKNCYGANKGWFFSPGHFTNMFNAGYRRIGFGNAGDFWTQVFG